MLRGLKTATVFNTAHLMPTCLAFVRTLLLLFISQQYPLGGTPKGEMKYIIISISEHSKNVGKTNVTPF